MCLLWSPVLLKADLGRQRICECLPVFRFWIWLFMLLFFIFLPRPTRQYSYRTQNRQRRNKADLNKRVLSSHCTGRTRLFTRLHQRPQPKQKKKVCRKKHQPQPTTHHDREKNGHKGKRSPLGYKSSILFSRLNASSKTRQHKKKLSAPACRLITDTKHDPVTTRWRRHVERA